ncbi:MAG: Spy/CpxP family protein refolding chaperone [Desulfobacteraceae bacterium]|nr:Spy/CpxP family protein refolding chaperone [Desulfobacteraceae bacterium]
MTKKKKTFVIVSISLFVIVVSGFSFVMITGACGRGPLCGQMGGHGFHKRGMPPFMHKEIGNFMLWRIDKGVKTLDLSETQQKQYNNLHSKIEETMDTGIKTRMEFKQQAIAEFDKENPDLAVISGKIQTDIELMSDALSENLALFTTFYNSLDDKQKNIITEKIKERIESHKNSYPCYERKI